MVAPPLPPVFRLTHLRVTPLAPMEIEKDEHSLSLFLFLSRFEALVRRFVRLGESTCSTASRVRSAARCLCNRVGMKFTIGTNPGSATISTATAAAASVPTTYAARFRGNRNPGSFVHFVNTSPGYVSLGIGVFV